MYDVDHREGKTKMAKLVAKFGLSLFAMILAAPVFGQAAPQRSADLCTVLQQVTQETFTYFAATGPGKCTAAPALNGYSILVDYHENVLVLALVVDITGLNGVGLAEPLKDQSTFWFSLSVFDNLVHISLGTKDQDVFEKMNKLAQQALLQKGHVQLYGSTQRATLQAATDPGGPLFLFASANTREIDKMKSSEQRKGARAGDVAGWKKVLALSLQAFAAGAKGYNEAYQRYNQTQQRRPTSCYTNLLGNFAITNCN
jgi:hypothetical protein